MLLGAASGIMLAAASWVPVPCTQSPLRATPSACCDRELFRRTRSSAPHLGSIFSIEHLKGRQEDSDIRPDASLGMRPHTSVLTLQFHDTPELILGPSRAFSVEGQVLRQHPDDEVVARRAHGMWHVRDAYAEDAVSYGFECSDPAYLQFEDRQGRTSPRYGPFGDVVFRETRCSLRSRVSPSSCLFRSTGNTRFPAFAGPS